MVSFPRPGINSTLVTIKGPKECVHGAKARILEMVAELDAQVGELILADIAYDVSFSVKAKYSTLYMYATVDRYTP